MKCFTKREVWLTLIKTQKSTTVWSRKEEWGFIHELSVDIVIINNPICRVSAGLSIYLPSFHPQGDQVDKEFFGHNDHNDVVVDEITKVHTLTLLYRRRNTLGKGHRRNSKGNEVK